jgi:hypothetical protein
MSSHTARERIMARLYASGTERTLVPSVPPLPAEISLDQAGKIERLATMMSAMRTEVHIVDADSWIDKLKDLARV